MKRNAVAKEVKSHDIIEEPGEFFFTGLHGVETGGPYGMLFCCPCGCGAHGSLAFDNRPADWVAKDVKRPVWNWNGSRDKPTLTPSILRSSGCKWHGHLRDGVFEEC